MRAVVSCLLTALAAGCGGDRSLPIEAACNPLGANACMTPWPSSAFEVDDPSSATGRRLAIQDKTLPINIDDLATDPTAWNLADGFSPAAPMVMSFPGGVSADGLPPNDNYDRSLAADSPTIILDMTTGERVAHFAEVDKQAEGMPDSQALFLRPAARLAGGHRYAVGITRAVHGPDGEELPVPPGFAALRDGKHTDHELLETMRPRFDEVLDALDAAGYPSEDLVVAWDFTVASDAFLHGDMIAARDRTVAALHFHPIAFSITQDAPIGNGAEIKRKITGTLDAPLFLSNNGSNGPGTHIVRDADGLPAVQGFYRIPFTAIVPACAYTASAPVGMVIYGHGLLGTSEEASYGVQQTTAAELCMVFVATDMRGMSTMDLPAVARTLNELSKADEVMEVLEQGLVNHITLVRAMRTTFATQLFVDAANANRPLVDPTKVYYYGLSQGAIFGTAVMAFEPTVTRAVLGVGGANYSMLLERSLDWPRYRTILAGAYPDPLDVTLAINLMQMRWDKTEGSGVADSVLAGTATKTPPKQLLMQIALGDEQVPNLGSYWQARSMKVPVLGPTPFTPWGVPVKTSPLASGSALVIMDGGAPPSPATNVPASDTGMHDLTRKQPATRRQIGEFFATGAIINECAGFRRVRVPDEHLQLANVEIRPERAEDVEPIRRVHEQAFISDPRPVPIEGALVDQLRADPSAWLPALSLVAVALDTVVGHVVCTRGHLDADVPALALGPLGIAPSHQGRGIGSALVRAVCAAAEDHGEPLVVLLGDPAFYSRLGFVPAAELGIAAPLPGWARNFQARPLAGFDPARHRGTFTYPAAFRAS